MYAIFQSGGKQHRVSKGQIIRLEKLDIVSGKFINFTKIMMIANDREVKFGTPFISDSIIKAEVVAHGRSKKIKILKFRRRKQYRKQQGHRQWFTDVKIISIRA